MEPHCWIQAKSFCVEPDIMDLLRQPFRYYPADNPQLGFS
jgi:hypothetical protein